MTRRAAVVLIAMVLCPAVAGAHPTPYSYVDVRMRTGQIDVVISAHLIDVAHDLGIRPAERLLDGALPEGVDTFIQTLLTRLHLRLDGAALVCRTTRAPARLTTPGIRWTLACERPVSGARLTAAGPLFTYEAEHQTFVNVYVDGALRGQDTLDIAHRTVSIPLDAWTSRLDTFRRLGKAGIHHILSGPDHLLFLAALLLAGGTLLRLATIVTAFTVGHSITLGLAVLEIVTPPPRLIEPLIALSIVYVGLRNLRPSTGRDWRATTAGVFGLIHGFGFAYALREMQLPPGDLAWSLLSFNLGVEGGQLAVVVVVALLLAALRRTKWVSERTLVVTGALVVTAAGAMWFVQRTMGL